MTATTMGPASTAPDAMMPYDVRWAYRLDISEPTGHAGLATSRPGPGQAGKARELTSEAS